MRPFNGPAVIFDYANAMYNSTVLECHYLKCFFASFCALLLFSLWIPVFFL